MSEEMHAVFSMNDGETKRSGFPALGFYGSADHGSPRERTRLAVLWSLHLGIGSTTY